ncbi:MAG: PAS domain-containing protein [Pseudobacter sp.]|uniref:sensor histidine kinase n=1 Tax=Pseudobacter sp. TaxID=2045420 RepID=UPI003F8022BB
MDKAIASAQERRFENIVKQAPVGITILRGKDMIVEMANDTYLQIVDRKESQFIGRSLYDVLPEVRSSVEPLLSKVFETGIPYHGYEFPVFLNRYGLRELTFFNFVYQALREEDGQITGVVVVANEVTSLVNAKRFLEESEREFRSMVMQSPIAMTIFRGTDFIIENANRTMLDSIWRMHESDVIGKKALDVFPELKKQKFPALLQQVFETGVPYRESEAFAIVVDQSFYFDYEYAPLRDREGKVTGILITVYDVTEKVITRQHVEEARERLQLAVEATNLANWDLDLRDYTILHSAQMIEIMGHPPGTVLTHQQMRSQLLPEDQPVLLKAMETALQSGIYQYEARIRIPNGNIRWVKTQGKVVFNESGEPLKMLGTLRDITEEKSFSLALENEVRERTQELALKNEALEKMNAELNSFAYVSSHDLQEPLRKIRIFAERITETELQNLTDKGQDYFHRIEKAASTMQTLINDLLSYSRTSNADRVTEIVSMNKILEEAREELKEVFEEKKALLHSDDLGQGRIIPFQFKQLLINLLSNSLKFAGQGRQPVINLRHEIIMGTEIPNTTAVPQQQYHHFMYTDNGIGFDNQFRERIFEIFQRLNSKEKFNGTGIGLAIVKKIVSNHQGFIEAHGERDKGAQFDIWFPVL